MAFANVLKKELLKDVSNNATAAELYAAFPGSFRAIESGETAADVVPKHLYICLSNLILNGIQPVDDEADDPPDGTFLPPSTDLSDYIQILPGEAAVPAETGIYIKEQVFNPVMTPPADLGSKLDVDGARFSIIAVHCRISDPTTQELSDIVFDDDHPLCEAIDLRIQWCVEKSARDARVFTNREIKRDPGILSGWLSPAGDITMRQDFPAYLLWIKTTTVHALEMTSFYQSEYVKLFL